ncbi:MAG: hypothetical protein WAO98_01780 [Alphaproteobacteria bacterium]
MPLHTYPRPEPTKEELDRLGLIATYVAAAITTTTGLYAFSHAHGDPFGCAVGIGSAGAAGLLLRVRRHFLRASQANTPG